MTDVPVIDRLAHGDHDLSGKDMDRLLLTSEQRRWVRGRFATAKGREIALSLPTGTVLEPGCILWIGPDWYLTVEATAEPILRIFPLDSANAIQIAFEIGNRHFQMALEDNCVLLVPDDPAMVQLLNRLGAKWERGQAIFRPIGHAHRHEPHQHEPGGHEPHSHEPHSHEPHNHEPHNHEH